MADQIVQAEKEPLTEIRRQVEQIEVYSRRQGWEPPPEALVCLPYSQARALLDQVTPPAVDEEDNCGCPVTHPRWCAWNGPCCDSCSHGSEEAHADCCGPSNPPGGEAPG